MPSNQRFKKFHSCNFPLICITNFFFLWIIINIYTCLGLPYLFLKKQTSNKQKNLTSNSTPLQLTLHFCVPSRQTFFLKFCFNITIASQDVSENSTKRSCVAFIQLSQMATSYITVQIDIGTIYRP